MGNNSQSASLQSTTPKNDHRPVQQTVMHYVLKPYYHSQYYLFQLELLLLGRITQAWCLCSPLTSAAHNPVTSSLLSLPLTTLVGLYPTRAPLMEILWPTHLAITTGSCQSHSHPYIYPHRCFQHINLKLKNAHLLLRLSSGRCHLKR